MKHDWKDKVVSEMCSCEVLWLYLRRMLLYFKGISSLTSTIKSAIIPSKVVTDIEALTVLI